MSGTVFVGFQESLGEGDKAFWITRAADRRPWGDPTQEAQLAGVDIADSGEVALVEQRLTDGPKGIGQQPTPGLVPIPVRAEEIRPEMAHGLLLIMGMEHLQHGQSVADGDPVGGPQDGPDLPMGSTAPVFGGAINVPGAVHTQMSVQGPAPFEAKQQMLSAR